MNRVIIPAIVGFALASASAAQNSPFDPYAHLEGAAKEQAKLMGRDEALAQCFRDAQGKLLRLAPHRSGEPFHVDRHEHDAFLKRCTARK